MYTLIEQSDVFVDALAADHQSQLLFVSAFGRDTSVQQFIARLHQTAKQGGIDEISACGPNRSKPELTVRVGDPQRLEKTQGRMPATGLLGNLVHIWIFDPVLVELDHATRSAWLFERRAAQSVDTEARTWAAIKELSPVPLLDQWEPSVLEHLASGGCIRTPPCIGPILTRRVEMPDSFAGWVSEGVRSGLLGLPAVGAA